MNPKKTNITPSAGRHRKYLNKIKSDPVLHAAYLEKQRKKYRERNAKGEIRCINEITEREKRTQRKRWRINSKVARNAKKTKKTRDEENMATSPQSPLESVDVGTSNKRGRGRPRSRGCRSKAYRTIAKLENTLEEKNRVINRLRKRCQRLTRVSLPDTPRSKTRKLMGKACSKIKRNSAVKKARIFHYALVQDLANVKSKGGGKKKLLQALSLNIIKKYRCKSVMQMRVGIGSGLLENPFHTKCRLLEASQAMKCAVKTFLERDDNSSISACKKDSTNSEQIRFLLHSLKTLHKKYT